MQYGAHYLESAGCALFGTSVVCIIYGAPYYPVTADRLKGLVVKEGAASSISKTKDDHVTMSGDPEGDEGEILSDEEEEEGEDMEVGEGDQQQKTQKQGTR